jgi:threonine/homoserine/homoserine lactone efflux protein
VLFAIGSFAVAIWRASEAASPSYRNAGYALAIVYLVWMAIAWYRRRSTASPTEPAPAPSKAKGHLRRVK